MDRPNPQRLPQPVPARGSAEVAQGAWRLADRAFRERTVMVLHESPVLTDDGHQWDDIDGDGKPDPQIFELSKADRDALNRLTVDFDAPESAAPFKSFPISWSIAGDTDDIDRIKTLWVSGASKPAHNLNPDSGVVYGTLATGSASYTLIARFASGFADLGTRTVHGDHTKCPQLSEQDIVRKMSEFLSTDLPIVLPGFTVDPNVGIFLHGDKAGGGISGQVNLRYGIRQRLVRLHVRARFVIHPEDSSLFMGVVSGFEVTGAVDDPEFRTLVEAARPGTNQPAADVFAERVGHSMRRFGDGVRSRFHDQLQMSRPRLVGVSTAFLDSGHDFSIVTRWCESVHFLIVDGGTFDPSDWQTVFRLQDH